jgi:uncharacterized membrane protein YesL
MKYRWFAAVFALLALAGCAQFGDGPGTAATCTLFAITKE